MNITDFPGCGAHPAAWTPHPQELDFPLKAAASFVAQVSPFDGVGNAEQ